MSVVPWGGALSLLSACGPSGVERSAIEIDVDPQHVLSAYVRWETALPSDSVVEFGEGARWFRIEDPTPTTEHRILVFGMRAETPYLVRASSRAGGRSVFDASVEHLTPSLPPEIPRPELAAHEPGEVQPGWTLLNASNRAAGLPPIAVLLDETGAPVWYHENGVLPDLRGDIDVSLVDGEILIGPSGSDIRAVRVGWDGAPRWTGPPQQPMAFHHHFRAVGDDFVALRFAGGYGVTSDEVVLLDDRYGELWTWNLLDHLVPGPEAEGDWSHCNSVTFAPDDDVFYLSCRNLSAVLKVSRADGRILWRLGPDGDFAADPDASSPWNRHQHDPEIQPNGNVLLYDNGDETRPHSRVVEFALDEEALEAEIVWEFPGRFDVDDWYRTDWYTPIFGDADRLDNGNTLVAIGTREPGTQSRLVEVTPDGRIVWELLLPVYSETSMSGVYRAERVPVPLVPIEPE